MGARFLTTIRFIGHDAREYVVDATDGVSVMRAASDHDVPGMLADCGGSMSCATCHVHVAQEWIERVGPPGDEEAAMLEMAIDPQSDSRLSCQIIVSPDLSGLTLNIPEKQF